MRNKLGRQRAELNHYPALSIEELEHKASAFVRKRFQKRVSPSKPYPMEKGRYEPNDDGFINDHAREAAKHIGKAIHVYCEGHYAHSNAKDIPDDHLLVSIMNQLKELDEATAEHANRDHDPKLFKIHKPTRKAKTRWNI